MSLEIFLLSMQAAGAIFDVYGTKQARGLASATHDVEMAQLNTRLEEERVAAAYGSLDAMKQLRSNLASQRAMFAARGQAPGAGSAFALTNASLANYSADERVRRMNLLSRESQLRSAGVLSGMHQLASETQLGQQMYRRLFDAAPIAQFANIAFPQEVKTPTKQPSRPPSVEGR